MQKIPKKLINEEQMVDARKIERKTDIVYFAPAINLSLIHI